MNSIKVLDVTLRDGGCVNDFNFGLPYMNKIVQAQVMAEVDFIEVGYLDEKRGTDFGRTQYIDEKVVYKNFLKHKSPRVTYVAMMDYGKFNPDNLERRRKDGLDGIRVAFHKKNRFDIIDVGKKIIDKGYQLYIQPMVTMRYSDFELLELIEMVNEQLPDASGFYIVDSFGEMRPNDMERMLHLVDHNLLSNITLGFHSHNNLQLSYSNVISLLQFPSNRNCMIDSSIMGMGKGAGNLATELLLEHLNLFYGKRYQVAPLLEVADKVINQIHNEYYWGYAVEYYLSAINHCTPSYASHFYNKHMLPIDQVGELLSLISEDKKISFDKDYAENLYRNFNENKFIDDKNALIELSNQLTEKNIIVIAPGKSIIQNRNAIEKLLMRKDVISISLNCLDMFDTDYIFTTRADIYYMAMQKKKNVMVMSNISKGGRGNVMVFDYKKWIAVDKDNTYDSSGIIILNILEKCNVKKIEMAGFDGYKANINSNYYNEELRRPFTEAQAMAVNEFFKRFLIQKKEHGMNIEFITDSLYQNE